jgi:hypothetical protein
VHITPTIVITFIVKQISMKTKEKRLAIKRDVKIHKMNYLTASLRPLPGLNAGTLEAAIWISAPV